jgi:O-antigen/teichoic acid export membrane protein
MISILKASAVLGLSTAVTLLAGVLRAKVAALWLGPSGVGFVSQAQNVALFTTALGSLAGGGLVTLASRARSRGEDSVARVVDTSVLAALLSVIPVMTAALFLRHHLTGPVFGDEPDSRFALAVAVLGGTAGAFGSLPLGLLYAYGQARVYAVATMIATAINVVLLAVLVEWAGLRGALMHIAVAPLISLLVCGFCARARLPRCAWPLVRWPPRLDRALLWELCGFALFSAVTSAAHTGAQVGGRSLVLHLHSLEFNGLLQVAIALGSYVRQLSVAGISADLLPQVSRKDIEAPEAQELLQTAQRYLLAVTLPMLAVTATLAWWLVQLFYSRAFLPIVSLVPAYVAAEVIRTMSFAPLLLMQARSALLPGALTVIVGETSFLLTLWALNPHGGLAYAVAWAVGGATAYLAGIPGMRSVGVRLGPGAHARALLLPASLGLALHVAPWFWLRALITLVVCVTAWKLGLRPAERAAVVARIRRVPWRRPSPPTEQS